MEKTGEGEEGAKMAEGGKEGKMVGGWGCAEFDERCSRVVLATR